MSATVEVLNARACTATGREAFDVGAIAVSYRDQLAVCPPGALRFGVFDSRPSCPDQHVMRRERSRSGYSELAAQRRFFHDPLPCSSF